MFSLPNMQQKFGNIQSEGENLHNAAPVSWCEPGIGL